MEKVILTDCDGVLLNWEYGFHRWMSRLGYELKPEGRNSYKVTERYGVSVEEKRRLCRAFNESAHIAFLPPLRDAVKYVRKLHEEHGYVFHVITSMTKDPYAQDLRKMNLRKVFGETIFEEFVFLDVGEDKDSALLPYKGTRLPWVEDKLENAILGVDLELDSVLISHDYNRVKAFSVHERVESDYIPRYSGWKQVYEHVTGDIA
jgi:hypothetical protein